LVGDDMTCYSVAADARITGSCRESTAVQHQLPSYLRLCSGLSQAQLAAIAMTRDQRRSVALHVAIAAELAARPVEVMEIARRNVIVMRGAAQGAEALLAEWDRTLDLPPVLVISRLSDPSEHGRDLRQVDAVLRRAQPASTVRRLPSLPLGGMNRKGFDHAVPAAAAVALGRLETTGLEQLVEGALGRGQRLLAQR